MLFLFFCFFKGETIWRLDEIEIFRPLQRTQFALSAQDAVYLADAAQSQVLVITNDGKNVGSIGRRGKGPGEFQHVTALFCDQHQLLVYDDDLDRVTILDADGTFLKTLRMSKRRVDLLLAPGGWFIGDWLRKSQGEKQAKLYWADREFRQLRAVAHLPGPFYHNGLRINRSQPGKAFFSPLSNKPRMALCPEGQHLFLTHTRDFRVEVFDIATLQKVASYQPEHQRIPMDDAWVQREMTAMKVAIGDEFQAKMLAEVPDHFPAIRDFWYAPPGYWVADLWRGQPDKGHHVQAFDHDGQLLAQVPSWQELESLMALQNGKSYHLIWDAEREHLSLEVRLVRN